MDIYMTKVLSQTRICIIIIFLAGSFPTFILISRKDKIFI